MRALALIPVLALTACASDMGPGGPPPRNAQNGNDCAVIAAVAKSHYQFGPDNVPPALWLDAEGSGWAPRCDWSRYGVDFPRVYDPDNRPADPRRNAYVQFKQPRYDADGRVATIDAAIVHGPLAGMGVECTVRSGFAGWSLDGQCRNTWIS